MSLPSGSFTIGPDHATLTVRTGTAGAMAKAGHNLEIKVAKWSAELQFSSEPATSRFSLTADSSSFSVIDGQGGPKALTDDDRSTIAKTVNEKILKGSTIAFTSNSVEPAGDSALKVHGDLTLLGSTGPVDFTVTFGADGHFDADAEVVQTAFGIKPYSAMMGALKVKDELIIEIDGELPS